MTSLIRGWDSVPEVREALLIALVKACGLQQSAQGVEVRPGVDCVRKRDHRVSDTLLTGKCGSGHFWFYKITISFK